MNAATQPPFEDLYQSATQAHQDGDLARAEKLYRKSLARAPQSAVVINGLCFALMQQGHLGEAETLAKRATKQHPDNVGLWNLLGHIHSERGHAADAMSAFRSAVALDAHSGLAWANLGSLELSSGEMEAAIAALSTATALLPTNVEALNNLALAHIGQGNLDQAEIALQKSLNADPKRSETYGYLGQVYRQRGTTQQAISLIETSIAMGTKTWSAFGFLGECYRDMDNIEAALSNFEKALDLNPDHHRLRFIRAEMFVQLGRYAEALQQLDRVDFTGDDELATDFLITKAQALQAAGHTFQAEKILIENFMAAPDHERSAAGLANFYDREGTPGAALPFLESNLREHPDSAEANYNLGTAYLKTNRVEDGIRILQQAIALKPGHIMSHQNLAMIYLRTLHMAQGWAEYTWRAYRFKTSGSKVNWKPQVKQLGQDLRVQSIEIVGEQGIGDELFFMRYLPALKARGAYVTYRVLNRKLAPLLETGPLMDQITYRPDEAPVGSTKIFAGDLPYALGQPDIEKFPESIELRPAPEKIAQINDTWLKPMGSRPKIGLAWRAGTQQNKLVRNVDLLLKKEVPLLPLLNLLASLEVDVVVLQRKPAPEELQLIADTLPRPFLDASDMDNDLSDTLALLAGLDGLVGVSNTNVHLSACLGGRGDILVPYPQDFRWPEGCERSPWFPQFDMHHQDFGLGWEPALTTLAASLNRKYGPK